TRCRRPTPTSCDSPTASSNSNAPSQTDSAHTPRPPQPRPPPPRPPRPRHAPPRHAPPRPAKENKQMTQELREHFVRVRAEVGKAVVGQDGAVTGLLIALLAGGHVLLEGVPGVAKTLLVRTLSRSLQLDTKRVQF